MDDNLPSYEESDGHHATDNKREIDPPDYEQSQNANKHEFEFVISELRIRQFNTLFVSEDSLIKYNSFKDIYTHTPDDTLNKIKDIQHQGIGMPLLSSEVGWSQSFKINEKMTIYRYIRPNEREYFDKKRNREPFCHIKARQMVQYWRYELNFVDSDKTILLFLHRKLPIGDFFSSTDGVRYRWLHTGYSLWNDLYRYELEQLRPGQPSMIDGMNVEEKKLDPTNELVGRKSKSLLGFSE